ncbi:MAG: aa3-type cytochrome c oxidase subunit IV [Sphingomicrobium sp.]
MALEPTTNEHANGDLQAHVRDYSGFTYMLKWGAIVSFIVAMLVLVIISK